mmetsp:Transcript_42092/g.97442  ORF Transcript_42092/g.97442 Transcript_42092/m.97442 type:complete len:85 (+) Transcript_42092:250-504(+)
MLYCRVVLGHIHYTPRLMKGERVPPTMPGTRFRFDSVVAEPGEKQRDGLTSRYTVSLLFLTATACTRSTSSGTGRRLQALEGVR